MKSGFVALIGRPNAGKSTLLNALVQQKIAIISPKPQTTRNSIRAIRTDADSQIIFVDTPGIHKPKHELGTQMNKEAYSAASGVDLIYYLVDGSVPFGSGDEFVLNTLRQMHLPVYLLSLIHIYPRQIQQREERPRRPRRRPSTSIPATRLPVRGKRLKKPEILRNS